MTLLKSAFNCKATMMHHRIAAKGSHSHSRGERQKPSKAPTLEGFLEKQDFVGALAVIDCDRDLDEVKRHLWNGYCAFHSGNCEEARVNYVELLSGRAGEPPEETTLYLACVHHYMQQFDEAEEAAKAGPDGNLKHRLLYHLAEKRDSEGMIREYEQQLTNSVEDQLSRGAMQYTVGDFEAAKDTYKRLLEDAPENRALHVYVAMCNFKLHYYDVSLENLSVYLEECPESVVATNLKACNHFRLYGGEAAVKDLKALGDIDRISLSNDIIRHNLVVFTDGEKALQVLPHLVDYTPEARFNLAICYLRKGLVEEAGELLKDIDASAPHEYMILKAVVSVTLGQMTGDAAYTRAAQNYFQLVGASESECDTMPGRLCMVSYFFLLKQFDNVNLYLSSLKGSMPTDDKGDVMDDEFNWNHGMSLAATAYYKQAEKCFQLIEDEQYTQDMSYISWLSKCYIENGTPEKAWGLYLNMESESDSFCLLQLIASECYRRQQFLFAARAFHSFENGDSDPEVWEGKRGACSGVFREVVAETQCNEPRQLASHHEDALREVLGILAETKHPQAESIAEVIRNWAAANDSRAV